MENRRGRIGTIKDKLVALSPLSRDEKDQSEDIMSTSEKVTIFDAHSHAHEHRSFQNTSTPSTEGTLLRMPKLH